MADFNEMVFKYTIKPSNKIKKICEPIVRVFGVKHFWYSRTTEDGFYFSIASNPEMHEYYHASNFHLYSPFFHDPKLLDPGFYIYRNIKDSKFQQTLDESSAKLNVELGASILLKHKKELIRFGYASDPKRGTLFFDLVFNNLALLNKFNEYFVEEAKEIIKIANEDLVCLPLVMGDSYNVPPVGMQKNSLTQKEKREFLQELGAEPFEQKKLSRREKECLSYYVECLRISDVAELTGLSVRTVEFYLENVKNKLGCHNKVELLKAGRDLKLIGELN